MERKRRRYQAKALGFLDRDATSPSKDPLLGIGGPMTRSKTKRMKQAF